MATTYGDILAALPAFRNQLFQEAQREADTLFHAPEGVMKAFAARPAALAFATPLTNVHATGAGVRVRGGQVVSDEPVIKVYVFDKFDLAADTPALMRSFNGLAVDVEVLPVQQALTVPADHRQRVRPIAGGVSIAPVNQPYVGTLGGFLRRTVNGVSQTFLLSNNHVLANVNTLPLGTAIAQPGPELGATAQAGDIFAALSAFVPILFPDERLQPVINRLDAAIALIPEEHVGQLALGQQFGIATYTPQVAVAVPGMRVVKSGRSTGVTRGIVTATRVSGVRVDYSDTNTPRIATFANAIEIVSNNGQPFSAPGDSGSFILDEATGRPVALLFAGDGRSTTACDLGDVCQQFQAFPV